MSLNVRSTPLGLLSGGLLASLCLAVIVTSVGCSKQPQIEQYVVKREPQPAAEPVASAAPRDRMLGAILGRGEQYWFFKLTGGKDAVAPLAEAFEGFIKSLQFSAGPGQSKPTWKLPEGWTQKPGNEFRFATIEIPSDPKPLELTVSALPRDPQGEDAGALLANVNRWRDQLRLKPLAPNELATETKQLDVAGEKVTLTDFTGSLSGAGMGPMQAAKSGRSSGPVAPATPPANEPANEEALPFTFEKPAAWQSAPAGGLRKLAFKLGGDDKNEVTVIDLDGGIASELLPNVNRWRGQVGLNEQTADELAKEVKQLTLGSAKGDYVRLIGADKAILGVIVRSGDRGWFFKLGADRATAEKEQANFEAFMQSVKFK
ncbi:MAG: hypothetical protein JNM18_16220 [Planctomycetaceae bacterium]|nr:hypothetical protein [Planctomycetaceae bacterium]